MGKRGIKAAKIHRQSIIRSLMARGLEQHEILNTLEQPKYAQPLLENGNENPNFCGNTRTGEPVTASTVSRDWKEITERWREESLDDVNDHFARQLAEIREGKRIAQAAKNLTEFRLFIQLEMKLLGTSRPEKMEHRWDEEQLGKVDRLKSIFQGMRQREGENGSNGSD